MTDGAVAIDADRLVQVASDILQAHGLSARAADTVSTALVEADLEGTSSHGVMLLDMYVERLHKGSVSLEERAEVVLDSDAIAVLDARNAFGQLTGEQAMTLAVVKAGRYGLGAVAVRNGFHFGAARRYALAAADAGCVGVVMCNTRPLMPAPGGAERVVGNNPLAIAVPSDDEMPLVLDMAMSEAAMGKIRMAAEAGNSIPDNWATKGDGSSTTDAAEAIAGMLLPAAGAKGFGLALMIDLLSGLLSGGAHGREVKPLYGDPAVPYGCAHFFLAIYIAHFTDLEEFRRRASKAAADIRNSARAPGVDRLFTPGEPEWLRRRESGTVVRLPRAVLGKLAELAAAAGVPMQALQHIHESAAMRGSHVKT